MMDFLSEPVFLIYSLFYLVALSLAVRNRETFPLGESLAVIVIIGVVFTGLVYWLAPQMNVLPDYQLVSTAQLIFIFLYLAFIAWALSLERLTPKTWKGGFLKNKGIRLAEKLVIFVILPLGLLFILGEKNWAALGFSQGDVGAQVWSSFLLILFFGGFNLVAGSGAAPIRKRAFSLRQLTIGFGFTYLWNVIEVGLVEEFFFRGLLQTKLVYGLQSPLSGILATSLLFGLAHAPGLYLRAADKDGPLGEKPTLLNAILYAILVLSPAGWFMGLLYWRTQSLLAPILVHAGMDAVAHTAEFIEGLKIKQ